MNEMAHFGNNVTIETCPKLLQKSATSIAKFVISAPLNESINTSLHFSNKRAKQKTLNHNKEYFYQKLTEVEWKVAMFEPMTA